MALFGAFQHMRRLRRPWAGHNAVDSLISSYDAYVFDSINLIDNGLALSHNVLPEMCPLLHTSIRYGRVDIHAAFRSFHSSVDPEVTPLLIARHF